MILFVLSGQAPLILLLALAIALYLTFIDLRQEDDLPFQIKAWWFLLVLLLHVPGYLIFRVWIAVRRRRPRERDGGGQA
jgi:hypothetical protein